MKPYPLGITTVLYPLSTFPFLTTQGFQTRDNIYSILTELVIATGASCWQWHWYGRLSQKKKKAIIVNQHISTVFSNHIQRLHEIVLLIQQAHESLAQMVKNNRPDIDYLLNSQGHKGSCHLRYFLLCVHHWLYLGIEQVTRNRQRCKDIS